ncbi:MAG: hypothetical protein O9311_08180 [Cytophagales bacterium]|jgi:hypothetical protein|nr:hypothetical protein [Cytophagales bacterium]
MKIVRKFLLSNCASRDGQNLVKQSALVFLGCGDKSLSQSVTATWVDSKLIEGLPKLYFHEPSVNVETNAHAHREQDTISHELGMSLRDVRQYFYDFLSYGVEPMRAFKKARTLCLMVVVENYSYSEKNWEKIYKALQQQKVQGELRCANFREFYRKAKWFMRMGLSAGILMSETQWSR